MMSDQHGSRSRIVLNRIGWGLVALEVVLAIVVTGITASAATGFRDSLHCSIPDKLNYNLAVVSLRVLELGCCND